MDGAAPVVCQTPLNLTGLLEGAHRLDVWALNAQGQPGAVTGYGWKVTPLVTTIHDIRTTPVAVGTRVSLSSSTIQLTIATTDRFWMQEATTPFSCITVRPTVFNAMDTSLGHGLSVAVVGKVADVNGNTTLVDATYTTGSCSSPRATKACGSTTPAPRCSAADMTSVWTIAAATSSLPSTPSGRG